MTTKQLLTPADLEASLADDRHLGFGYATSDLLGRSQRKRLDAAVLAVANELGLDAESFFHWTNSKWGRWLIDAVYGRSESPTRATVRNYLSEQAVAEAKDLS